MILTIKIDCNSADLHDNIYQELECILKTVPRKIYEQLERDGRCICEALESANALLDSNGNTVGTIKLYNDVRAKALEDKQE